MGKGKDLKQRDRREATQAERQGRAQKKAAEKATREQAARQRFLADLSKQQQHSSAAPRASVDPGVDDEQAVGGDDLPAPEQSLHTGDSASVRDVATEARAQTAEMPADESTPAEDTVASAADTEATTEATAAPTERGVAEAAAENTAALPERQGENVEENVDCVDIGEGDCALDAADPSGSMMSKYATKLMERLRQELSSMGASTDNWLLQRLKANGWWLKGADAHDIMMKHAADSDPACWPEPYYLRDIFVWLPDVRWGEMPPCPRCAAAGSNIYTHDFLIKQPTRR